MFCGRVSIESIERKYSFIIIALFCEMDIITKNVQLHEKKLLLFFFYDLWKTKTLHDTVTFSWNIIFLATRIWRGRVV